MNAMDIAKNSNTGSKRPADAATRSPLLGRKSVLMGILTSGFVIANAGQSSAVAAGTRKPSAIAATVPATVPRWAPQTGYVLGQQVISPNNDVVSAKMAHTSSSDYPTDTAKWTLSATFGRLPDLAERAIFVSPRGSDANDGLSPKSAKLTLTAALVALGGNPGTIQLGAGTINTAATFTLPRGTSIIGAARGMTTINYTGTGTLFQATSGTRTYDIRISGMTLSGPGTATASCAVDLVDASCARIDDCNIASFGTAVWNRSTILGGAVYNRVYDCVINSCDTGVLFGQTGSNSARIRDTKFGACTIAVNITDSNENVVSGCAFEVNGTGVKVDATLGGLSDGNSISECRFEVNTTDVNVASAFVRDTAIIWAKPFGSWVTKDLGTRTRWNVSSAMAPPPGTQRYRITRSGSYTPIAGDDVVFVNAASVTLSLPSAVTSGNGRVLTIKNIHSTALTVNSPTAGTIDGTASKSLAQYAVGRFMSDGANWFAI